MTSLAVQFDQLDKKVATLVESVVKELSSEIWKSITPNAGQGGAFGSPVLTGRFYTSHRIGIGSIDYSTAPENPAQGANPYPALPLGLMDARLASWKFGQPIYITNSLDYADDLEGGFSTKTPNGVYRVSAEYAADKFKAGGTQAVINRASKAFPSISTPAKVGA